MGKWFDQAAEIDKLRREVRRQAATIEQLRSQLAATDSENFALSKNYSPLVKH